MLKNVLTLSMSAALLAGCFQAEQPGSEDEGAGDDTVFIKFHPQEEFCVEYNHSGMISGTSKQCMRKWGTEIVAIEKFVVGMGGFSQQKNAHNITLGDQIYVIDPVKMTGTVTKNPLFEGLSETDPIALGKAMMASWNMNDTGADKTIAGTQCNVMDSPQMGSVCLTDNMVMLEQSFMGTSQIATKVDLTSGGDEADYLLYKKAKLTDGPDVAKILEAL
ncbi:MAG: hypothetical protein KUG65_10330 [Sphingomonadaceae bacterium]|nr:hypothetical protein [Sphingomonadaceae bacterium]